MLWLSIFCLFLLQNGFSRFVWKEFTSIKIIATKGEEWTLKQKQNKTNQVLLIHVIFWWCLNTQKGYWTASVFILWTGAEDTVFTEQISTRISTLGGGPSPFTVEVSVTGPLFKKVFVTNRLLLSSRLLFPQSAMETG